jgi:uncharacterized membrane protein YvlD (DUF360 family)
MNPDFENALVNVLNIVPLVTFLLAGIGFATVISLIWATIKPVIGFLGTSQKQTVTAWAFFLIIVGCSFFGYSQLEQKGAFIGGGASAAVLGIITLVVYWLRQWVKWTYNEKD